MNPENAATIVSTGRSAAGRPLIQPAGRDPDPGSTGMTLPGNHRSRQRAGQDVTGLTHHSDRGVQYRAVRYTERLAEAEAVASVGSKGDSYDNAMAEALNSLFKAECIRNPVMRPEGGWKSVRDVEIAVAEYIDWYNHRRLHGEIGHVPPAEFETNHWDRHCDQYYAETPVLIEAGTN
jgi:hypothetical protein